MKPRTTQPFPDRPFSAEDALELLHHEVVQAEALIGAAFHQLGEAPRRGDDARRENERAYALLSAAADTATEALRLGEDLVRELGDHLKARSANKKTQNPKRRSKP